MTQQVKEEIIASIQNFKMPRYQEIPEVGFYLEQVATYMLEYLSPLESITITGSMISNYVKKGLLSNPVKKQYSRDQIAYLFFIAIAKTVLSMDDIRKLVELQKDTYTSERAYDYFCQELENVIFYVFGIKEELETIGVDDTDEKEMLRNTIMTVAHKIYLDKCFARI